MYNDSVCPVLTLERDLQVMAGRKERDLFSLKHLRGVALFSARPEEGLDIPMFTM